jgi:GMP synthase (glutamine-hydrolysing)
MQNTKPFLILQLRPEDSASNSEFKAFLKYGDLDEKDVQRIRIEKSGIPSLDLNNFCGIIVGGSPFDISISETKKSDVQKKIEADFKQLFAEVIANDFPFLGACSGNGLLGSYLKSNISTQYAEPVGSTMVKITAAGKKDELLRGLPSQIKVLLGHKEACDTLPKDATLLISGKKCPIQMFRVKNNIYATQFHPEGDSEGFITRIHAYKHHGYFSPDSADELISALKDVETPHAQKILKRFVDRYKLLNQ